MPRQERRKLDTTCDEPPPAVAYAPALETRLTAMRALVARLEPGSDAEALRLLRAAFPETSLAERVTALAGGEA